MKKYIETPIPEGVGNDDGFDRVPVCPEDFDTRLADPLVRVDATIIPYYAGNIPGITCNPCGQPNVPLLRKPFAQQLYLVANHFKSMGFKLVGEEFYRSLNVQTRLYRGMFKHVSKGVSVNSMSVSDLLHFGQEAANVVVLPRYNPEQHTRLVQGLLNTPQCSVFEQTATPEKGAEAWAAFYVRIACTLGLMQADYNFDVSLPHPSGGSADIALFNADGSQVFMGAPSGSESPCAAMRYFEGDNLEEYRSFVANDKVLRWYFTENGYNPGDITRDFYRQICANRRLLYGVMNEHRLTPYEGEWWHWNGDNLEGGNQNNHLPLSGNGCQAVLKGAVDKRNGLITANWGIKTPHMQATELGYV